MPFICSPPPGLWNLALNVLGILRLPWHFSADELASVFQKNKSCRPPASPVEPPQLSTAR